MNVAYYLIWNSYTFQFIVAHIVHCWTHTTHSKTHIDTHTHRHVLTAVCLLCAIASFSVSSVVRTFNYKNRYIIREII